MNISHRITGALLLSLFLASCGGGGGGGNDNACGTVVDIAENSSVSGVLQAGDCTVNDIIIGSGDPTFVDEYRITLIADSTLTITMRSTVIDTFLILLDSSSSCASGCDISQVIDFNDDFEALPSLDSQIIGFLTAGTYIIGTNSFDVESGSYTLETTVF